MAETYPGPGSWLNGALLLVMIRVDLDVLFPFRGDIVFRKNRFDRAFVDAQPAINAGVGIDVQHFVAVEFAFILAAQVNAIDGRHTATHDASLVPMQGSVIMCGIWALRFESVNYREMTL